MVDPHLDEIVRRLVAAYEPLSIYLIGSHARNEAGPDSDIDLVVIVPDDADLERQRSRLGYEALRGTGTAVDVIVWTESYFEDRQSVAVSLQAEVVREGRLLFSARLPGG
jgi:predicted nucleotidyltransferase